MQPTEYRTDYFELLYALEEQWGHIAVPNLRFGMHDISTIPDPDIGWRAFYGVGSARTRTNMMRGPWDLRGSVPDIEIQSDSCAGALALPLGKLSGSTITIGQDVHDLRVSPFTMQARMYDTAAGSFSRVYTGGKVNRATLSGRERESLRLSLEEILFQDVRHNLTDTAKGSDITTGTDPGIDGSSSFFFSGTSISFGGIVICELRDWSLTIDNQLVPRYYMCQNADDPNQTQTINGLQEGKSVYSMGVGIDVLSNASDLTLFKYLMNNSALLGSTTGGTIGFTVIAIFAPTPGMGTGQLAVTCAVSPGTDKPGTVVKGGKINQPAPPVGVFGGDYVLDTSDVTILLPTQDT